MINWHLETRKLSDLKDHPKNPRKLDKDQAEHLQKSLEKFGLIDKPIINLDNQIIGGHQRKNVLKKMKLKQIECFVPDHMLTPEEVDELNIRLNRNTGDWDWDILANQWDTEQLIDWGFKAEEFIGASVEEIMGEDEEDSEMLEPTADPITKIGDVYELNKHILLCGDNQKIENIEKLTQKKNIQFSIADPPYNLNFKYQSYDDNKSIQEYQKFCETYVANALSFSEFLCVTPGNHNEHIYLNSCFLEMAVWNKKFALTGGKICSALICEPILFLGKKLKNMKYDTNYFEIITDREKNLNKKHGCPKPVSLWKALIEPMTIKGEVFLEMFGGSGTSWIAAEQLGRTCYGIELDPAYCDIIIDRWKKYMVKSGKQFTIKKNGELVNG